MRNIAIILAGGGGTRTGFDVPKQFVPLTTGRTVVETCIDAFEQNDNISHIAIVIGKECRQRMMEIVNSNRWNKYTMLIDGGKERFESSWNAIQAVYESFGGDCNLLLHDAARPFISQNLITSVCKALEKNEAVSVCVPVTDTIYICTSDNTLLSIPPRHTLRRAQTPQAFRCYLIYKAYTMAMNSKQTITATDDCAIVHQWMPDTPIALIDGEESNRKLTYKEDFLKQ